MNSLAAQARPFRRLEVLTRRWKIKILAVRKCECCCYYLYMYVVLCRVAGMNGCVLLEFHQCIHVMYVLVSFPLATDNQVMTSLSPLQ